MKDNNLTFEAAMLRLEEIVRLLEGGKITLDESLKLFEEGTRLSTYCNNRLEQAQNKINQHVVVRENSSVGSDEESEGATHE